MRLMSSLRLLMVLAFVCASGCGKSDGTVTGKVTFEGKPVLVGSVMFIAPDEQMVQVAIDSNGNYTAGDVPYGKMRVAVVSPEPLSKRLEKMPPAVAERLKKQAEGEQNAAKWFAIPESYGSAATSGLTLTVDKKETTFNIELKAKDE